MQTPNSRRSFLAGLSATAAAGCVGSAQPALAGPQLETTTVRLPRWVGGAYCWAGAYIAEELMRAEGLTDVRYVEGDRSVDQSEWIARGETDFSVNFPPNQIASIDSGVPIKVLTGLHSGQCRWHVWIAAPSIRRAPAGNHDRASINILIQKTPCASTPSACRRPA